MALPNRLTQLYHHLRQSFWSAGIETSDLDARLIIKHHTGFDWGDLMSNPDAKIPPSKLARIEFDVERRLAGEPVSRIFGVREFWGMNFKINPYTLDPRPDTETLVEVALELFGENPPESFMDMGTGSGCILLSLLEEWRDTIGFGMDRSFDAIEIARENAKNNDLSDRSHFWVGTWGSAVGTTFPLIVSNPPYIPNYAIESLSDEVKKHDPILALSGGNDGFDAYKIILREIKRFLDKDGVALLEIGYDQSDELMRLIEDNGFVSPEIHPDLAGTPRVVEIRWP